MRITNISKIQFKGLVYNFHCLPNENYFSEGALVHNCYKSNTCEGDNMSLSTFKHIIDIMPKYSGEHLLTQIAFGVGDITANKDLWSMMEYCRANKIVPNITINGKLMTPDLYDKLANYCGAVAVSYYDKDVCFSAVQELTNRGMHQVNIHCLLSDETFDKCLTLLDDIKSDVRLGKLNAVVFLWLKPKGERNTLHQLSDLTKLKQLVDKAFSLNIKFGFDSCSAANFIKVIKDHPDFARLQQMIDPCESTKFSAYISCKGVYYPCSFAEGVEPGIDLTKSNDFLKDAWLSTESFKYRELLDNSIDTNGCRNCPLYDLECKAK